MTTKKPVKSVKQSVESIVAKSEDGSVQITFTIPFEEVKRVREEVLKEVSKDLEIPGFRKGKAPKNKVLEKIPENTLVERILSKILPKLVGDAITKHKLKLALYPKFEIIKAKEDEDWQIRAVTAEFPEVDLGNYKKALQGAARAGSIWTPKKGGPKEKPKEPTPEEKEQLAIKILLETTKVKVPKALIDAEVNSRLAKLLERIEKLGLSLDSYLASVGKTAETMRSEYEKQAKEVISLDLALNKIANEEKIKIAKKEIESAIKATSADPKQAKEPSPNDRRLVEAVLRKRAALEKMVSLL